jgi:DNA-binding Xre family transcriptional regulator
MEHIMKKLNPKKSLPKKDEVLVKTTSQRLRESMTPKELKKHEEGYRDFILSELLIEITNENELSVRKLAQAAGLSPRIVQAMRSGEDKDYSFKSILKILQGLRCKKFTVTTNQGKNITIPLVSSNKKN